MVTAPGTPGPVADLKRVSITSGREEFVTIDSQTLFGRISVFCGRGARKELKGLIVGE
jgi:hypothetical protein